jgi:hypothetical protein
VKVLTDLLGLVRQTRVGLADKRRGMNTRFSMADIGMAAFSAFFMQSPSFLAHQRQLSAGAGQGRSNCQSLFGMAAIPCDNHIRDMLDFVEPSSLCGLFDEALAAVERAGALACLHKPGRPKAAPPAVGLSPMASAASEGSIRSIWAMISTPISRCARRFWPAAAIFCSSASPTATRH